MLKMFNAIHGKTTVKLTSLESNADVIINKQNKGTK